MADEPTDQRSRGIPTSFHLRYWRVVLGLIAIGEVVLVVQLLGAWGEYRFWRAHPCEGSTEECFPLGSAITMWWWGILAFAWPIAVLIAAAIIRGTWSLFHELLREGRRAQSDD